MFILGNDDVWLLLRTMLVSGCKSRFWRSAIQFLGPRAFFGAILVGYITWGIVKMGHSDLNKLYILTQNVNVCASGF